jgi:hypothetical protein
VNKEKTMSLKEEAVAYFNPLIQNSRRDTEGNNEKS